MCRDPGREEGRVPTYNPGAPFRKSSPWNPARKHPKTGVVRPHRGEDWAAPEGTAIPAAADGSVVHRGWIGGYGNVVVLEHTIRGQTVHTLYAHMNVPSPLAVGTKVTARQKVGTVGMTGGVSTGNHLHFEVMPGGTPGAPNLRAGHSTVDPRTFDFPGGTGEAADDGDDGGKGPWSYPFGGGAAKAAVDAGTFLGVSGGHEGALARTDDGFYPIGANSLWHGGVHFDAGSGSLLNQHEGVRCIHDGEVVAYRVDTKYREIVFSAALHAAYSTGFTLVRHRLEIPDEKAPKREALVFYSLYMHLLDWQGYSEDSKRSRPGYWGPSKRFRVGERAKDRQDAPPPPLEIVADDLEGDCGVDDDGETGTC